MVSKSNTIESALSKREDYKTNYNTSQKTVIVIDYLKIKYLCLNFLKNNVLNILIVVLLTYLICSKTTVLSNMFTTEAVPETASKGHAQYVDLKQKVSKKPPVHQASAMGSVGNDKNTSRTEGVIEVLPKMSDVLANSPPMMRKEPVKKPNIEANVFDNVSIFLEPKRVEATVLKSKREKCWDYIRRFIEISRVERQKFGIPVSITLAQGLLESDAGESRLTQAANNHFGIKTFNRHVPHVVMKDDTPTDKFKKYDSAWESYRDHSLLLMKNNYKNLQFLSKTDYVNWAKGLQKAGYATDPQYAQKLTKIIENLQLYKLDEI